MKTISNIESKDQQSKKHSINENNHAKTIKSKNTQQKADNLNKQLNNVEYLLKVEEKNKRNIQTKYEKDMAQIVLQKEKNEAELDMTLKEINEKEAQIFEIQKNNFDVFKEEIQKYQTVLEELKLKSKEFDTTIIDLISKEGYLNNKSIALKEEYMSYQNEITNLRTTVKDKMTNLRDLESSYPKDFKFLQEDFQLAKELSELKQKNIALTNQIKQIDNENTQKKSLLKENEANNLVIIEEHKLIGQEIDEIANNQSLIKLKEHLIKNIKEKYLWDTVIFIMREYFSEKIFDVDNKYHERLNQQLIFNFSTISKDFSSAITKKESEREVIIKRLNELQPNNQLDKNNYLGDINQLQKELENLTIYINSLKMKYSKLEVLYNNIVNIIQSNGYECSEKLDEQFRKEILQMIIFENKFSIEEIGNFEHLIQTFFTEMGIKERSLKSLRNKQNKVQNQININNQIIQELTKEINEQDDASTALKQELNQNASNIKIRSETIIVRNKNLKANLEMLSEEQFKDYLKKNEEAFKTMKKIYGNKIVGKVYKVQKEKLMNDIIKDQTEKKLEVNHDITFISQYDTNLNGYKKLMGKAEFDYHSTIEQLTHLNKEIEMKKKEKTIIDDSIIELEEKIQSILESQVNETTKEKERLKKRFNIEYHLARTKELNDKLDQLEKQKLKLQAKYNNYQKIFDEKTQKLHFEDLDIKNNLITVLMGVNDDASTIIPFRHHSDKDSNSPCKMFSTNSIALDENVHKSLADFNKIDTNLTGEGLKDQRTNSLDHLDYKDISLSPEMNLLKEKLKPLYNGLLMYKRYNYTTGFSKYPIFNPMKAKKTPPENCGYVMRQFKLNQETMSIDVYPIEGKRTEMKISLKDIKKIMLDPSSKEMIKQKDKIKTDLNQQLELLTRNDYIQFTLILKETIIELISTSYLTFTSFETAVNEMIPLKQGLVKKIQQITFAGVENDNDNQEQIE